MFKALVGIFLLAAPHAVFAQDTPQAMLHRAESFTTQTGSYRLRAKVVSFAPGKPPAQDLFQISHKEPNATLVEFLNSEERGKSVLVLGDALWLRLPNLSRPIQISPAQRMSGNVSSLDILRTRLELDYNATTETPTTVDGEPCILLDLRAKHDTAAYQHVDLLVRKKGTEPVRADFYLASGQPSKTIDYSLFDRDRSGKPMLRRMIVVDHLKPGSRTEIEYSGLETVSLPSRLFQLDATKPAE